MALTLPRASRSILVSTLLALASLVHSAPSAAANKPPVISGAPATSATVGVTYSFRPTASDPEGRTLTFSISNKPAWAWFSKTSGRLGGTPSTSHIGKYSNIIIRVSDGVSSASLPAFSISVKSATNQAPKISGIPGTSATIGAGYSFQPTASDPEGKALAFSISNKPAWASFSTSTGRLSGTPSAASVGTYSSIVIRASDGVSTASLPAFSITVKSTSNGAPTISGTPANSATVGAAYSFQPSASDPDGQALTFSIANKPSWASFSTSTGRLSGTPSSTGVGSYTGIVIGVSDGSATASLPSFTLTVQQVQTGSATITWTPPTTNTDNSALTNLRGYRIYFGTSSSNLSQMVDIPNPGISSAVIEALASGTWYFAVKAYNTSNVESSLSNVTSKAI